MSSSTENIIEVPSTPPQQPPFNISISTDTLLMGGFLAWILWDKVMKPTVADKLGGVFAPIEEERRLNNIMAQLGLITGASRVVLAAFHNGAVNVDGYHLQKLTAVNNYIAPGVAPMNPPIRDLPIGRIMFELEEMLDVNGWTHVSYNDDLPQACKDHLNKNNVKTMFHRIVRVGNLPIGILSIQYTNCNLDKDGVCLNTLIPSEYNKLTEDLYNDISTIMRRRVIQPSLPVRLLNTISHKLPRIAR